MLAQAASTDYATEFSRLGLRGGTDAVGYGFEAPDDQPDEWDTLTELWRSKISERRAR